MGINKNIMVTSLWTVVLINNASSSEHVVLMM